jgi:hypothetical protein
MLSEKKTTELYGIVHEEVMQARLKIWKMKDDKNVCIATIDDILSDLCKNAPQKAIDFFKPKNKTND